MIFKKVLRGKFFNMKTFVAVAILLMCLTSIIVGQTKNNEKIKLVQLPAEFGKVMIVSQPDCPVKIEEFQLFAKPDGSAWDIRYIIRNESSKGVRYLSYRFIHKSRVGEWKKYGSGIGTTLGQADRKGEIFLEPNDYIDELKKNNLEIIPMTRQVKELFTNKNGNIEMRTMWIGMITEVVFEDGTIYDAESQYDSLFNFLLSD
jgi:hypothetical protein